MWADRWSERRAFLLPSMVNLIDALLVPCRWCSFVWREQCCRRAQVRSNRIMRFQASNSNLAAGTPLRFPRTGC